MFKYLISSGGDNVNSIGLMMLLSFFFIFSLVFVVIFFLKKDHAKYMAQLPLDLNKKEHEQSI